MTQLARIASLLIMSTFALSCGGGGGDAATSAVNAVTSAVASVTETGTASVSSTTTDTITTGTLAGAFYNNLSGQPASSTRVFIQKTASPDNSITVIFSGSSTGSFDIASGQAQVSYKDANAQEYASSSSISATGGTVTVSQYGDVGSAIIGTFDVTADVYVNGSPSGTTTNVTGAFTVVREADDAN